MPEYDTCYFWDGEKCAFEGECSFVDPKTLECTADDYNLMTYEDYLQWKETQSSTPKEIENGQHTG